VQVELSVLHRRLDDERRLEFDEEPEHDHQTEDEYESTWPRLPLIYVRDVVDLHLHHTETITSTTAIKNGCVMRMVALHSLWPR